MTEPIAMSPRPKPTADDLVKTIKFSEAITQIIDGKKVHKLEWGDKEYYGFMNGDILSLHKPDGKNYQWIISMGDLMGDDYIII